MLRGIVRLLLGKKQPNRPKPQSFSSDEAKPLSRSLSDNLDYIRQLLGNPYDLVIREFLLGDSNRSCAAIFIDGMTSKDEVNNQLMRTLLHKVRQLNIETPSSGDEVIEMVRQLLSDCDIEISISMDESILALLEGNTLLFVDGASQLIRISSKLFPGRAVDEPETEAVIRGPRDGFTENLQVCTALVRRHIRDPNLRFHMMRIGRRSKKPIVVAYMEGIAHPQLIKETIRRLESIDIDDAEGSGFVEQWIADSFLTPFPLIAPTERPDKVSSAIIQGKIGIIVDGTPFALILPITISSVFQSPEDYYSNWFSSSLIRLLRYGAAFIATFLPGLYVALLEYHHGMIPSKLVFSIAGSREGVPFPAFIEAIIMEITLEVLREAGVRLPKPIGQTIGIVGGLVIGEAAVSAGVVSPIMVIVVSLTAIASFALPSYGFAMSLRLLRFFVMLCAAFMGLYGLILAYIMMNIHAVNLKSFGVPYTTPYSPTFLNDFKDLFVRLPVTFLKRRPAMNQPVDRTMQSGSTNAPNGSAGARKDKSR